MAMYRPSDPNSSTMRCAWPPAPNVQSTTVCPDCGLSSSSTSSARTGSWAVVGSPNAIGKTLGTGRYPLSTKRRKSLCETVAIPNLQILACTNDLYARFQARVLAKLRRQQDAPLAVQVLFKRARGEKPAQLAPLIVEDAHGTECPLDQTGPVPARDDDQAFVDPPADDGAADKR